MGKADRTFRGVVGVVILAAGFFFSSWWGLIGLIPLGTALVKWCPAYVPFKLDTRPASER
jgi:hypothetical protein